MFQNATNFNGDLTGWNTQNVTNMQNMFNGATVFNQSLGSWNLSNVTTMINMLNDSGMDCLNYSNTLLAWAYNSNTPNGVELGAKTLRFSIGTNVFNARQYLIGVKGWMIFLDQGVNDPLPSVIISGESQLCENATSSYFYTTNGGTWINGTWEVSSNLTFVLVNTNTINVTTGTAGGGTINYVVTKTTGCTGTVGTEKTILISPLPNAGEITGLNSNDEYIDVVCLNETAGGVINPRSFTLNASVPNGAWSVDNSSVVQLSSLSDDQKVAVFNATTIYNDSIKITYTVTENNCTSSASKNVYVTLCDDMPQPPVAGIDDVAIELIDLFPNPATSMITLKGLQGNATITLTDINGKIIENVQTNENTQNLSVESLPQGMYMVQISSPTIVGTKKFVVQ